MLDWKQYGKQNPHVYWSAFKQEGDVGLVTKFKGKGDGYNPENAGPFQGPDGYTYQAVHKTGKSGKPYWDVERWQGEQGAEQVAHTDTQKFYKPVSVEDKHVDQYADSQARIDKAHQENLEVERAKLQELKNINETLGAILKALYKEA